MKILMMMMMIMNEIHRLILLLVSFSYEESRFEWVVQYSWFFTSACTSCNNIVSFGWVVDSVAKGSVELVANYYAALKETKMLTQHSMLV